MSAGKQTRSRIAGLFSVRTSTTRSPGGTKLALLVAAAAVLGYPLLVSEYTVLVSISFLTFGILVVSQVHVWGFGGIFSFAQAAFFALGAYAYAVIAGNIDNPAGPVIAFLLAPLVVLLLAAVLGYFIFYGSMDGFLLGIVTLSFSLMLGTFLNQTGGESYRIGEVLLGGYNGINNVSPLLVGGVPASTTFLYYLTAVVLLAGTAAISLLRFQRLGIGVRAVAEKPERAELFGYNVRAYRLGVFVTGAAFAAAGGQLYALWGSYTSPGLVTLQAVTLPVVIAAVAGRDRAIAAMLAALAYAAISQNLASDGAAYALIVLGVGLIVVMLVAPGGVGGWLASSVGRRVARRDGPAATPDDPSPGRHGEPVASVSQAGDRA